MSRSITMESYARRFMKAGAAERYATRFESAGRRRIHEREVRALGLVMKSLRGAESVLDMPCGTGRFLPVLAQGGRNVVQADVSPAMLELARRRANQIGIEAGFAEADAASLLFPADSFDVVFCNRLLHHIVLSTDRLRILRELHRVTRSVAVISFFRYRRLHWLRCILKRVRGRTPDYNGQPSLPEFAAELAEAGFAIQEIVAVGSILTAQHFLVLRKRPTSSPAAERLAA